MNKLLIFQSVLLVGFAVVGPIHERMSKGRLIPFDHLMGIYLLYWVAMVFLKFKLYRWAMLVTLLASCWGGYEVYKIGDHNILSYSIQAMYICVISWFAYSGAKKDGAGGGDR